MIFEPILTSRKKNVAYLVGDEKSGEVAVVDAGYNPHLILGRIEDLGVSVKYILATHRHADHIRAAPTLRRVTGALLAAFKQPFKGAPEIEGGVDLKLDHGDELRVGRVRIQVIHTPGHTSDSICLLVNNEKLFTGDTLYVGKVPGTKTRQFYDSLHERVLTLDNGIEVWPGHDVGKKPSSTIGRERRNNPSLKMNFDDFRLRRYDKRLDQWVVPKS